MKFLGPSSSGSLADTVYSRNRYGQYTRRRAQPMNPVTPRQTTARERLATLSSQWAGLDAGTRALWEAWANAHPRSDSLGQSVTLSGAAQYISTNAGLLASEFPAVVVPPGQEPEWPSLSLTLTMAVTATVIQVTFSGMVPRYAVQVWAGKQGSAGVAFDRDLKLLDVIVPSDVSPLDVSAPYIARWGYPLAGARFHYAFRRVWDLGALDVFLRNSGITAV